MSRWLRGKKADHEPAQVHQHFVPKAAVFHTAHSQSSPSPAPLFPHISQGMSTGLSHPCGQGRKTLQQGGSKQGEAPGPLRGSRKHMGADKSRHNRTAPKNRPWPWQRKRCWCGFAMDASSRYQVPSPVSLPHLMKRTAPRWTWTTTVAQS